MIEMRSLIDRLNQYRDSYYNNNESLVSDKEYDDLYDQLERMENESGIIYPDSPTQNIGYEVKSKLEKVRHNHPLLSMAKETDKDLFLDFFGDRMFCLMAKMDGLTISLKYIDGKLISGETRGDGEVGEDVTHNVMQFVNVPLTIPYKGELIVDGEAIIDRSSFDAINQDGQYKNQRNLVSGTVRQLDSKIVASRKVKFIAWKLYSFTDPIVDPDSGEIYSVKSYFSRLWTLKNLGFEVVPSLVVRFGLDPRRELSWKEASDAITGECDKFGYPIDGLVGTFDDVAYGESLGNTSHHPKCSMAFKFYQERNETTLLSIEWKPSRSGTINPVAVLEPVEIDGTTVSRASLSNVSIIKKLKLGIGDTVRVIKANQIIPQIVENLTQSDTYKFPDTCPVCGRPAEIVNTTGAEVLMCTNYECEAKALDRLCHFVSRQGMNIVGLSEKRLEKMCEVGLISGFHDLYKLNEKRELLWACDFGDKVTENILSAIDESRKCQLSNLLVAIGIPGVGKAAATEIAKYCAENFDLQNRDVFKLFIQRCILGGSWSELDGIGLETEKAINEYVCEHRKELEDLCDYGDFKFSNVEYGVNVESAFERKIFCITGKLNFYENRDSLVSEIESLGGKVVSGVTKNTDYLICNDKNSGSSKVKKAISLDIQIITEEEYISMKGCPV